LEVCLSFAENLNHLESFWREHFLYTSILSSVKYISPTDNRLYQEKTFDPYFKGSVITTLDEVIYYNTLNIRNKTFQICKEHITTAQIVIVFQRNSYLTKAFNEKLQLLKANGVLNFWISRHMDTKFTKIEEEKVKTPKKLTIKKLLGSFQVWIGGLCIAGLMFVVEVLLKKMRVKFRK
jgi:hypothetical protein